MHRIFLCEKETDFFVLIKETLFRVLMLATWRNREALEHYTELAKCHKANLSRAMNSLIFLLIMHLKHHKICHTKVPDI
jgi:hypothetical protein